MPLVIPLIILSGLVAAAIYRSISGPIVLAPDEGLFGRGTAEPHTERTDLISGVAVRLAQAERELRLRLFGKDEASAHAIAERLAAATREQLASWAVVAKASASAADAEIGELLERLAVAA